MDNAEHSDHPSPELRERALARLAEAAAGERTAGTGPSTEAERQAMLHELRVHQIELELQNEELRRAQLELEASRQRWFELYDLAPVGYCTLGEGGQIQQVNLMAAELLGQPRAGLARRRFSEFIQQSDQPGYSALLTRLRGSLQPQSCELRVLDPQGTERWVQITATATEAAAAGERSVRIVLQDITARRQAQIAQAALRLAEQIDRNRSEFLSRVSHEFRTPLNAILGFSSLLLQNDERALPDKASKQLRHIHDAGSHLLQMVNDLLDVSRAKSGRLAMQIGDVDMLVVLRGAMQDVAAQARAAGVALELEAHAISAAVVSGDRTRLRQVLQNLLTNAVKYNRAGGWVACRLVRHGEYWTVCIADNGIGMTPEQQAALFQPFNRLGREAVGIEGTGLGLVIARDLVQAMGGRLSVRSTPGQGAEFEVELLASEAALPRPPVPVREGGVGVRADVTGRVLCVDHDLASRELIRCLFEQRPGIELEVVETGAAGIAAARRRWPDLLLIDLRLPDMPGLDVLKVLRQLNPHLPLRCLVVSAESAASEISSSRAAGADAHLAKPIEPGHLLPVIDRLLARGALPT